MSTVSRPEILFELPPLPAQAAEVSEPLARRLWQRDGVRQAVVLVVMAGASYASTESFLLLRRRLA